MLVCHAIAVRRCEEALRSRCVDGTCLPVVAECDGHRDCVDGSDEENCPPLRPPCRPDETECVGGGCVFKGHVCDGVEHCADGSDENCGKSVNLSAYQLIYDNSRCHASSVSLSGQSVLLYQWVCTIGSVV